MGNGAKAASKRERNAKDAGNVAKSQLKSVRFFFHKRAALVTFQGKSDGVPYPVH
jgi:hypothetical protein